MKNAEEEIVAAMWKTMRDEGIAPSFEHRQYGRLDPDVVLTMLARALVREKPVSVSPVASKWMTIPEAAAASRTSTKTIRRWIHSGSLNAQRIGPRLIRIDPESLDLIIRPAQEARGGVSDA